MRASPAGAAGLLLASLALGLAPGGGRDQPASSLVREARDLARAGDSRARDRYLEAIKQNPLDTSLRAEFADYLWTMDDATEAETQMDWLVDKGHPRPGFLRYYGLRLFEAGSFVKAARVLERAGREAAPDYELLFCLGAARLESGDFRGSEETFRQAIEKAPDRAAPHHLLGRLLNLTARRKEAIIELRKAADADPTSANIWLALAQTLAAEGRRPEAEEACRRSISIQPDRAASHLSLGQILRSEGKKDEAASELATSRSLYDREEERVEKSRASTARTSRGWVLLRLGQPTDALAQFENVSESSSSAWRGRAEALERIGRKDDAIQALEHAKILAPEDRSIDYALERLRARTSGRPKR